MFVDTLVHELNHDPLSPVPQCLFFADDGLLLSRSVDEAKKQLAVASRWAVNNGMMYNVLKCGVIAASDADTPHLLLCGQPVPYVQTYKYLGFPVTANGIDFCLHLRTQTNSAALFLKFVQAQCSEWSMYTRHVIYMTFLRPKLEYGAPLTYTFCKHAKSMQLLVPLAKLQTEVLAWVLNGTLKQDTVLRGILGALTVEERFSHLRCGFQLHLEHSDPRNPIRRIISRSTSARYVFALRKDPLYSKFLISEDLPSTYKQLKVCMFNFLSFQRLDILSASKSVLVNYIPHTSRTDGLVDNVLTSPVQFQRTFVSWRRGSLFLRMTCVCGKPWNRGHIDHLSKAFLSPMQRREFNQCAIGHSKNFSEADYLLNVQLWDVAWELLKRWGKELEAVKPP